MEREYEDYKSLLAYEDYQRQLEAEENRRRAEQDEKRLMLEIEQFERQQALERRKEKIWSIIKGIFLLIFLAFAALLALAFWPKPEPNSSSAKVSTTSSEASVSLDQTSSQTRTSSASLKKQETTKASSSTTPSPSEEKSGIQPFTVQVSVGDVTIHKQASKLSENLGNISVGTYTIVDVKKSEGYTWGRLASGQGWIALDFTSWKEQDHSRPLPDSKPELLAEWSGLYSNWTMSIRYRLDEDGSGAILTGAGEIPIHYSVFAPSTEVAVWGYTLSDDGAEPQKPKEYKANVVVHLRSDDGKVYHILYGVLLKNGHRELTAGHRQFVTENSIYRKGK